LLAQGGILQGDLFLTAEDEKNETNRNHNCVQHGDTSLRSFNGRINGLDGIHFGEGQAAIFRVPSVVAHQVHTPFLILGVWVVGGALAMCGAFIWAELATRLPGVGGQYAYLRDAYHPAIAAAALLALTAINCLGARVGSNVQSALMLMKTGAIAALVVAGLALGGGAIHPLPLTDRPASFGLLQDIGAALIP
jgi:APA family basic amino acid/polyamine antiporter